MHAHYSSKEQQQNKISFLKQNNKILVSKLKGKVIMKGTFNKLDKYVQNLNIFYKISID